MIQHKISKIHFYYLFLENFLKNLYFIFLYFIGKHKRALSAGVFPKLESVRFVVISNNNIDIDNIENDVDNDIENNVENNVDNLNIVLDNNIDNNNVSSIEENIYSVFSKSCPNLKSLSFFSTNSQSAFGASIISPFTENCSKIESIVLKGESYSQLDSILKEIWSKLPELKLLYASNSEVTKSGAKLVIQNCKSLMAIVSGDFYVKSSSTLEEIDSQFSKLCLKQDLRIESNYSIFMFQ